MATSLSRPLHSDAGAGTAGYIALTGDLGGAVSAFKDSYPLLVIPAKLAVSFPLVRASHRTLVAQCCLPQANSVPNPA